MRSRPILFSGAMVRALLAGTKTQTRRIVKWPLLGRDDGVKRQVFGPDDLDRWMSAILSQCCPYGRAGDRLWVRETWAVDYKHDGLSPVQLAPTVSVRYLAEPAVSSARQGKTRVSIHMPRWASRITLEVTDVRVERVQDISGADAIAEGIDPALHHCGCERCAQTSQLCPATSSSLIGAYSDLWRDINGAASWDANPFVWVVSFKVIQ